MTRLLAIVLLSCLAPQALAQTNTYTLGGQLTGLVTGSTLVLQNGLVDVLSLNADGAFTFADPVLFDANYAVFVKTQPSSPTQWCTVTNGSGTMPANDVNDVLVTCTVIKFTVVASVSGLASDQSVVLLNNGTDAITIFHDGGPYSFPTQLPDGSSYNVTVGFQPDGQTCTVTNGSGTVSGATVTDPLVTCVDDVTPSAAPIPTLSQWALIMLSMFLGLMVFANRRRLF